MEKSKKFEVHSLTGAPLPFIFHLDVKNRSDNNVPFIHWHPNIEILYIIKGEGIMMCDNNEYSVKEGDIFLVNSNCIHYPYTNTHMEYYCLITDNEFCLLNDIDAENTIFETFITSDETVRLYKNVISAFSYEGKYKNTKIKSAVLNLLLETAQNFTVEKENNVKRNSGNENIRLALGFIKSHFTSKLTLDEISSEVGMSKYHFLREFKSYTGYTPINYINRLRCNHAKKLLSDDMYNISEISEMCGFTNFSYFSKTFKILFGCSPSEFMQKGVKKSP